MGVRDCRLRSAHIVLRAAVSPSPPLRSKQNSEGEGECGAAACSWEGKVVEWGYIMKRKTLMKAAWISISAIVAFSMLIGTAAMTFNR